MNILPSVTARLSVTAAAHGEFTSSMLKGLAHAWGLNGSVKPTDGNISNDYYLLTNQKSLPKILKFTQTVGYKVGGHIDDGYIELTKGSTTITLGLDHFKPGDMIITGLY